MSSTEISIEMENRGGRDVQGGCSRRGGGAQGRALQQQQQQQEALFSGAQAEAALHFHFQY